MARYYARSYDNFRVFPRDSRNSGIVHAVILDARVPCVIGFSAFARNPEKWMIPGIAIVAEGIPVATGIALAFKMRKTQQFVACFFGDGAVAEGAFHEAVNMASLWNVPVLFVCENNLYGASTRRYRSRIATCAEYGTIFHRCPRIR